MKVDVKPARKSGYYLEITQAGGSKILHSKYAPAREAKKWYKSLGSSRKSEKLFLLGGGLGYLPRVLEEHGHRCQTIELLPEYSPPGNSPAAGLLEKGRLHFLDDPEDLEAILDELESSFLQDSQVLVHPHYDSLFSTEDLESIYNQVQLKGRKILRQRQTRHRFYWTWFDNLIDNFRELKNCSSPLNLNQCWNNKPVVIVGSGPSAGRALDWLEKYQDRFLVLAVDTAVSILQAGDVEPDIVLTTDPQEENALYIDGIPAAGALVAAWTAHPDYFRWARSNPRLPVYVQPGSSVKDVQFPISRWLLNYVDGLLGIQSGGSVTSSALDLAQFLGAGPIGIVGVDHAFTYHRSVSAGSKWEQNQLGRLNRFTSLAQLHLESYLGSGRYSHKMISQVSSREGKQIYTTDEYLNQNEWFEDAGGRLPARCLDFRSDGLKMENWETVKQPGQFWQNKPQHKFQVDELPEKQSIKINTREIARDCRQMLDLVRDGSGRLTQNLASGNQDAPAVLRQLYEPYKKYEGLDERSPEELATEFLDKLPRRLQNLLNLF